MVIVPTERRTNLRESEWSCECARDGPSGDCESRLLLFQFLVTNSRLGELFFVRVNYVICIWFCVMDFTN